MLRKIRSLFWPWLILTLLLPLFACQNIKKGTQTTSSYLRGEYRTVLNANLARGLKAVRLALNELSLTKLRDESDALTGIFECTNVKGQKIVLQLEMLTEQTSSLRIQVDIFGDEDLSRKIAQVIQEKLR